MTRIYALCLPEHDKLHLWRDAPRDGGPQPTSEGVDRGLDDRGLRRFDFELDAQQHQPAHFKIHGGPDDKPYWELDEHTKTLPRTANYDFPELIYCVEGTARVLTRDPFEAAHARVTVHLVTASKYREGHLLYWSPGIAAAPPVPASRVDEHGPVFELQLSAAQQHWFSFKFVAASGKDEPEYANRLWCSHDGAEVWVHSQASAVSSTPPVRRLLSVCTPRFIEASQAQLHLWQEDSDFVADVDANVSPDGTLRFEALVYSDRPYRFMFRSRAGDYWEDTEARRNVFLSPDGAVWTISGDGQRRLVSNAEVWTLDGDHELFGARPQRNQEVVVNVAARDPAFASSAPLTLDVWVNHGRTKLYEALAPDPDGSWYFQTFPEVVTSFVFRAGDAREPIERHTVKIDEDNSLPTTVYVVLGRSDALPRPPVADLFADPSFDLYRPGAWLDNGGVHFVLHCPTASCVEVVGEWTNWERHPIPLQSTRDGTFFWGQVDASSITGALGRSSVHGVGYKFLINQRRFVQDPAADWVENSAPSSQSQLVDHGSYAWRSNGWQRPGWEYLIVYQAHPNGFAEQNHLTGFDAITREVTADDGYVRRLGATALLLLPVAEYAMENGWGYNPSFFYAVESSYGGPDALKRLVDACHERGMAVLVDVVFNHAGTGDNALWAVASKSYFDGDTEWGAMINFDHPQAIHFFEQNLLHFMRNYRIDGFRFDFTELIRNGQHQVAHVRVPGSGGGYDFLQKLRAAVWSEDGRCLLMAEQFPNDLGFTSPVGPMDTQWNDAFHDLILAAAQESNVMSGLADALKATQGNGEAWYEMTNYPESHDEVGNEDHRISGQARGYRRNKVAAAATLFARGIPMWFMGAEYGEYRQFRKDSRGPITLHPGGDQARVRRWWDRLCELRRGNPRVQGPAPLDVKYAQDRMLAFTRGGNEDLFVLLNFSPWEGQRSLAELNLPAGEYKELLNSTWSEYQIIDEGERDRSNGGWDARLIRDYTLNIPAFSAVVLERR